jgi:hypothetical protein
MSASDRAEQMRLANPSDTLDDMGSIPGGNGSVNRCHHHGLLGG